MQILWKRSGRIPHLEREEAALIKQKEKNPDCAAARQFHIVESALRELDIAYYTARLRPAPKIGKELRIIALGKQYLASEKPLSYDGLCSFLSEKSLTVSELLYFPIYLKAAAISLLADSDISADRLLAALRRFPSSDGKKLLLTQSELCRILMNDKNFASSDDDTRIECLKAAAAYAIRKGLSESEAGKILVSDKSLFKLLKKNRPVWLGIIAVLAIGAAALVALNFILSDPLAVLFSIPLALTAAEVFVSDFVYSHFSPAFVPKKACAEGSTAVIMQLDANYDAGEAAESILRISIASPEAKCIAAVLPRSNELTSKLSAIDLKERINELQKFVFCDIKILSHGERLTGFDFVVTLPYGFELQPGCIRSLITALSHPACDAAAAVPDIIQRPNKTTLFSRIFQPRAHFAGLNEAIENLLARPVNSEVYAVNTNKSGDTVFVRSAKCISPKPKDPLEYISLSDKSPAAKLHKLIPYSMAILLLYSAFCTSRPFFVLLTPIAYAMLFPILSFNRELWAMLAGYKKGAALRDFWTKARVTLLRGILEFSLFPTKLFKRKKQQQAKHTAAGYYKSFYMCVVLSAILFTFSSYRLGGIYFLLSIFFALSPLAAYHMEKERPAPSMPDETQTRIIRRSAALSLSGVLSPPSDTEGALFRLLAAICAFRMSFLDLTSTITIMEDTVSCLEKAQGKDGLFTQNKLSASELNGFAACAFISARWGAAQIATCPQEMYDIWEAFLDLAEITDDENILTVFHKYYRDIRAKVKQQQGVEKKFNDFMSELSGTCTSQAAICAAAHGFAERKNVSAQRVSGLIDRIDLMLRNMKLSTLGESVMLGSRGWLAVFAAIIKGELPPAVWNDVQRALTIRGLDRVLISERAHPADYFLAHIFIPYYQDTLLTESASAAARAIRTNHANDISYMDAANEFSEYAALASEIDPELAIQAMQNTPADNKSACIFMISACNALAKNKTHDDFMSDPAAAVFSELVRERAPEMGVVISAGK